MYKFLPYMTNDYSTGLYSDGVNDIYHSAFGALSEAYEKFVNPIMPVISNKHVLNVLDICYGIGYNTKAFLNEIIKRNLSDLKICIDCVDNDKNLIELSPFISSEINLLNRIRYKNFLRKNVQSYDEANKIFKINNKSIKKYKINNLVNKILVKNLINQFGYDFLSEDSQKIMTNHDNHVFFDPRMLNFFKILLKFEVELHLKENKSTFVHNIYYKNISKRFIKRYLNNYLDNINIKFYPCDIRDYLMSLTDYKYDIVFLDGFTPAKCPCIWSVEFFNKLYSLMDTDGVLVTYNTSAPVRNAMKLAGFNVGETHDIHDKIIGTTASKNISLIKHSLSDKQEGLLNTKAGIPYHDETLSLDNGTILLNRDYEVKSSELITSSKYLKEWELQYEK